MKRLNIFAWKRRISPLGLEYFSQTLNRCKQPISWNFWNLPAYQKSETFCAISYHLYVLKSLKNTHGGVLILTKWLKPATLVKVIHLHKCFLRFSNGTNGTKSRNAPQMISLNKLLKNKNRHQCKLFISKTTHRLWKIYIKKIIGKFSQWTSCFPFLALV